MEALCQGWAGYPWAPNFTDHLDLALTTLMLQSHQEKRNPWSKPFHHSELWAHRGNLKCSRHKERERAKRGPQWRSYVIHLSFNWNFRPNRLIILNFINSSQPNVHRSLRQLDCYKEYWLLHYYNKGRDKLVNDGSRCNLKCVLEDSRAGEINPPQSRTAGCSGSPQGSCQSARE